MTTPENTATRRSPPEGATKHLGRPGVFLRTTPENTATRRSPPEGVPLGRPGVFRHIALLSLLILAGCGQDRYADLRTFMAQAGQGTQQRLEPLPLVKPQAAFSYDPTGLPDPFSPRSMKPSKGGGGIHPDLDRTKGPLEQDPLDSLHMVGTISRGGQLYGLVRRHDGTLYRVAKGDYIGQNFGVIQSVSESGLTIKEMIQDGAGDWTESNASMALQE